MRNAFFYVFESILSNELSDNILNYIFCHCRLHNRDFIFHEEHSWSLRWIWDCARTQIHHGWDWGNLSCVLTAFLKVSQFDNYEKIGKHAFFTINFFFSFGTLRVYFFHEKNLF